MRVLNHAGDKPLTTAIGVGDGLHWSEIGHHAISIAQAHANAKEIVLAIVTQPGLRAQQHVERWLRAAPAGACVLIACANSKVYDDASPGLHITIKGTDIGDPKVRARARKDIKLLRPADKTEIAALRKIIAADWNTRQDH